MRTPILLVVLALLGGCASFNEMLPEERSMTRAFRLPLAGCDAWTSIRPTGPAVVKPGMKPTPAKPTGSVALPVAISVR